MELQINQQTKLYPADQLSLQQLLDLEKPNRQTGIAVAVNQSVIPKNHWADCDLKSGDVILIITATQGG